MKLPARLCQMVKTNCLLFIFVLICLSVSAQTSSKTKAFNIAFNGHYGHVFDHRYSSTFLIEKPIHAFDLKVSRKKSGKELWHHLYKFPYTGFGLTHGTFGNKEIFGNYYAVYRFINASFFKTKYFWLNYNVAYGLAYITKPFDRFTNQLNSSIGSHLNAYLDFGLETKILLKDKYLWTFGLAFSHCSNGAAKKPNLGINVTSFYTGISRNIGQYEKNKKIEEVEKKISDRNQFSFLYEIGAREAYTTGKRHFVCNLSANYERILGHKTRIGAGIDFFKDNGLKSVLSNNYSFEKSLYLGVHLSFDLIFGKTAASLQWGSYVISEYYTVGSSYHRLGLKYNFTEKLFGSVLIKSQYAAAEFVGWGIGVQF